MLDFSNAFKNYREDLALNMREMADVFGVDPNVYHSWESLGRVPSVRLLSDIAEILEMKLSEFIAELEGFDE